jgi:multiple sugar transport system ATP-binding protein
VERIGARTIVHLSDNETATKTVFDNDVGLSVGEMVGLAPHLETVRLFDAATGSAIGVE